MKKRTVLISSAIAIIAVVIFVIHQAAARFRPWPQEPDKFMSIGLGQPISSSLRTCNAVRVGAQLCFKLSGDHADVENSDTFYSVDADLADDKVWLVSCSFGKGLGPLVLQDLVEKFGKPFDETTISGATRKSWIGKKVTIVFQSNNNDEGSVLAVLNSHHASMSAEHVNPF